MIKYLNNISKKGGFFGFDSVNEAISIALGIRNTWMTLIQSIVTFFGVITIFVNDYLYNPPIKLYVLLIFLVIDYITGVFVGVRIRKEGFSTRKGQRIIFLGLSYSFAMIGSFWLSKAGEGYFFMPYIVFYYLSSVVVLSSFKNLAMLGFLPKGLSEVLNKYVDAHKNDIEGMIKKEYQDKKDHTTRKPQ